MHFVTCRVISFFTFICLAIVTPQGTLPSQAEEPSSETPAKSTVNNDQEVSERQFLKNIRQLTFVGKRAGEGYFS